VANVSTLGNQIYINQNVPAVANKYISSYARLTSQDIINSDNFEENHKRTKETRETEETEGIDENLVDNGVYKTTPKYPKRKRRSMMRRGEDNPYIIDEKNKKIDVTI